MQPPTTNNHGLSLAINQCHLNYELSSFQNLPYRIMDLFSLSVVTYLKFCGLSCGTISHDIDSNSLLQPKMMSHATCPQLFRREKSVAMGPYQCLHYLKEHGVNLDVHLSIPDTSSISLQQILGEIDIFINLMSEKLFPLYIWQMWGLGDYSDYQNLVWNGWFQNSNSIMKWIFVSLSRKRYSDWLSNEDNVKNSAMECLESLSVLLGDKKYFYGTRPSTLDAIVYAYLAPLKNISFKCPLSRELLSQFSNLESFVETVSSEYFSDAFGPEANIYLTNASTSRSSEYALRNDKPKQEVKLPPAAFINRRKKLYTTLICGSISLYVVYVFRNVLFAPKVVYLRENEPIAMKDVIHYDNQSEEHEYEYFQQESD